LRDLIHDGHAGGIEQIDEVGARRGLPRPIERKRGRRRDVAALHPGSREIAGRHPVARHGKVVASAARVEEQ
jgi:hypothetical protein